MTSFYLLIGKNRKKTDQLYSVPLHLAMRLVIAFADTDDIKVKFVS